MSRSRRVLCSKDVDLNLKSMGSLKQRTKIFILELSLCLHFRECGGRKQDLRQQDQLGNLSNGSSWKEWSLIKAVTGHGDRDQPQWGHSDHLNVRHKAEQRLWKTSRRQRLPSVGSRWCHSLWRGAWEVRIKVSKGAVPSLAEGSRLERIKNH